MKYVLFYHSFVSCWNHGNAHFLRGVVRELTRLQHRVTIYEPRDGWSRSNALADGGASSLTEARHLVPDADVQFYENMPDLDAALQDADVVIAHEWNPPQLIAELGRRRSRGAAFTLLFHDTHHRAVSAPEEIDRFDLDGYDGVLAFGETLRQIYLRRGWGRQVFTWHEAADTALFRPRIDAVKDTDLIWIGNWGDDERGEELERFLLDPARQLGLRTRIHGVRYPRHIRAMLKLRGVDYAGWLPNLHVPDAFAAARVTVHVPRRPYVAMMPGIPTIRMFEALACGIPLVSAPWRDEEGLFPSGSYLMADSTEQMANALASVLRDLDLAASLVSTGLHAIETRHTCAHRVEQLLAIVNSVNGRGVHGCASEKNETLNAQQRVTAA